MILTNPSPIRLLFIHGPIYEFSQVICRKVLKFQFCHLRHMLYVDYKGY